MEFGENIQGLSIWGLRWRLVTSGRLDTERPCAMVKGCYSQDASGELTWGSGEGEEQGWVGAGDGVSSPELGTTSGVVNWAVKLLRRSAGTSNAVVTRTARLLIGSRVGGAGSEGGV